MSKNYELKSIKEIIFKKIKILSRKTIAGVLAALLTLTSPISKLYASNNNNYTTETNQYKNHNDYKKGARVTVSINTPTYKLQKKNKVNEYTKTGYGLPNACLDGELEITAILDSAGNILSSEDVKNGIHDRIYFELHHTKENYYFITNSTYVNKWLFATIRC